MLWRPVVKNLFKGTNLFLQRKNSSKCMTVKEVYDLADLPTQSVCIKVGHLDEAQCIQTVMLKPCC